MALEKAQLDWVLRARRSDGQVTRLLSLGYPDLLVTPADVPLPPGFAPQMAEDGEKIAKWHGWPGPIMDAVATFNALDIHLDAIDIRPSRDVETVLDLNQRYEWRFFEEGRFHQAFDIILDPGTLEHCFNIGQAFLNVAAMIAPDGTIIHTNPLSCQNHGFYNLCPTAYADFYGQNGFTIKYLGAMAGPVGNRSQAPLNPVERIKLSPEVWSLVVVKAPADWNGHAKMPTQHKYLANPDLKA
jgi:hypothetical protein